MTYVPTEQEGFLFLAVILDVFSRRVVGWSMADHLRAELVLAALDMAVWNRHPRLASFTIRIMAANIPRRPLPSGVVRWGSSVPWARPAIVTITPWPRASLRPWSVNCWIDDASGPMTRRAVRSLPLSRASTTASDATRLWGICLQRSMKGGGFLLHRVVA